MWGQPEKLTISFNTTSVGLERRAGLCCDLPIGMDERQQAGDKQGLLEQLVYMLANGTGRVRGAKTGGLQTVYQWRTVALSTGEEPLTVETSKGGVSTRALQIYGPPFGNEQSASAMYGQVAQQYGTAGPAFIQRLAAMEQEDVQALFREMRDSLQTAAYGLNSSLSEGVNGAHTAAIALVALADAMADSWLFRQLAPAQAEPQEEGLLEAGDRLSPLLSQGGLSPESWARAKTMALDMLEQQQISSSGDVNENAVQFLVDWVLANRACFNPQTTGVCYGMLSQGGETAYIFPSILSQALTKAGFSTQKTLRYLAEQGLIEQSPERKERGRRVMRNTVKRRIGGRSANLVCFHLGLSTEPTEKPQAPAEGQAPSQQPEPQQTSMEQWADQGPEGDLPF